MLIEVSFGLWVGDDEVDRVGFAGACVHANKHPCHLSAVGYKGSLPKDHPEYLVARRGLDLYLNVIDAPLPTLFRLEPFQAALNFIDEQQRIREVAGHCNQGLSRAPAIAALWLAKRAKVIAGGSWPEAKAAFLKWMPAFSPGAGIDAFLATRWEEIA